MLRTVIMPFFLSTLTTVPSIFSGAWPLGADASPRGDAEGWQLALVLSWASAGPPASSAAATTAAARVNVFMWQPRYFFLVMS